MTILAFIFWVVITFFALGVVTPFKGKQSKNKVHFYVARDKIGSIWLYMGKPKRDKSSFCSTKSSIDIISSTYFSKCGLDANNYANLKWEDEPVEVFLNMED